MLSTMNQRYCDGASNDRLCRDSRRRGRGGFTLAEILIALGILAIGMAMVAAIFPAAMEFNRASTNSTLGTIICENGLVLSELTLTAEVLDAAASPGEFLVYADDKHYTDNPSNPADQTPPPLTRAQQHYPTDTADSRTGFVMMARKVPNSGSTYQFVTVAYRKTKKSNTVELKEITCTVTTDASDITHVTGATDLRIGTPLINKATGKFAFVDSINIDGTTGTLERSMPTGSGDYYVLIERNGDGTAIDIATMRRSPAIGAMSKMTGLRRDPTD